LEKRQQLINARNFAAECIKARYLSQKDPNKSVPRNTLPNIIREAIRKYELEKGELKTSTIKGRFRKHRAQYANGWGVNSPMVPIEKLLVSMILRQAAMCQPSTFRECLELANFLIEKYVTQVQLVEWKQNMLGRNFTE
jgi:hypothetical protein